MSIMSSARNLCAFDARHLILFRLFAEVREIRKGPPKSRRTPGHGRQKCKSGEHHKRGKKKNGWKNRLAKADEWTGHLRFDLTILIRGIVFKPERRKRSTANQLERRAFANTHRQAHSQTL